MFGLKNRADRPARFRTHSRLEPARKLAIMPGKTMMLTAKISGIMPAELTFNGM